MRNDNRRVIKNTTNEVLKNLEKIFSNLDNSLFYMNLKPYNLETKSKKFLEDDDMIPITWNSMFKVMIYNDSRLKYSKYFLEDILPERYRDFTLYKSETNKNTYENKNMTVDFVGIKDDLCINLEMNMSNTLERNANYLSRLCSSKVKSGGKYTYLKGIQININGFKPPHNKTIDLYYTRDRVGNVYLPQIFVNIYLQNLWELYYNVGVGGLSKVERMILVMTSESKKEAERIAKGDKIMEEYIEEAKHAIELDDDLRQAYDHEEEGKRISYEYGKEEGREEGKLEIAKEMRKQGFSLEQICSIIKMPIDKLSSWLL